jgi:hypothetical protein
MLPAGPELVIGSATYESSPSVGGAPRRDGIPLIHRVS